MELKGATMSDEAPLTREQMNRFVEKIKEPFNEARQQKRRSVEVSAGFFEKVAILSAGATTVLASLILAIANKSNIHAGEGQIVVHELLRIAFILGASLIFAVLHNLFAALVARADAAIAEATLLQQIIAESLPLVKETTPETNDATLTQIEEMMLVQMAPRFKRGNKASSICYWVATGAGGLSMVVFIAAFVLAMVYLGRLW
jgi:hypothetical protein